MGAHSRSSIIRTVGLGIALGLSSLVARADTPSGATLEFQPLSATSVADEDWCGEINSVVSFRLTSLPRPARSQHWLSVPQTLATVERLLRAVYGIPLNATYSVRANGEAVFLKLVAALDPKLDRSGRISLGSCQPNEVLEWLRVGASPAANATSTNALRTKPLTWKENYFLVEAQAGSIVYRHFVVIDEEQAAMAFFLVW